MILSMIFSWSQELLLQVAAVDVPDDMRGPCVEAVQIRTTHMLDHAQAVAHLLNPRRRSLRYYESVRRTTADLEVVTKCDSFLLVQTGGDPVGETYLRVREQMRSFHTQIGHMTDRVTRDAEAEACIGDDKTSKCASWWVEHGACFPDLQEIADRVMHMWTSASPAERNWAEHGRIHTTKRNKLEFRKVAQLVDIDTNLKLLGCSERRGRYVLPWGHIATLVEAQPEEYTHPLVDDEDEEEEPEPEEWGARPQSVVPTHEISAQVRRFQQQAACRPAGVAEVFGARAEILHPYDYVPPPPAESVQALEDQTYTEGGEDLPAGVDKSVETLLHPDPPVTQEAAPMEGDSGELDGGHIPDAEGDDGAGDAGHLAPGHSVGLGDVIRDDGAGDDPVEVRGSMSLALVLRDPSTVAHEVVSQPVDSEGGGGVDEEGEGGTTHDHHDPVRADLEEGQITPGLLDPHALHRAQVEDLISRGPPGSHRAVVRSPPLYTPLSPLYSGSPASLECEQQRSESIRAAALGTRTTHIPLVRPPPPAALHGTPPPARGSIVRRGHMSSSSSRLDTQQSLHHPWSTVRRVDDGVRGDFAAQRHD
ncbi:hypothetical protein CBR_g50983 [Chara braunii]|uniref:HAT C-terminal dimerisation domain-containing protein n=1 Tax=Chara braunii TaxID=69332 RepID=A0A388M7S2_CHABU|nr:hypothetical protein CBR_g50983 [Chara braunii]|eukprot:GBG90637.1 hypothetical protein CBR_g50983 [Chara braunii]